LRVAKPESQLSTLGPMKIPGTMNGDNGLQRNGFVLSFLQFPKSPYVSQRVIDIVRIAAGDYIFCHSYRCSCFRPTPSIYRPRATNCIYSLLKRDRWCSKLLNESLLISGLISHSKAVGHPANFPCDSGAVSLQLKGVSKNPVSIRPVV